MKVKNLKDQYEWFTWQQRNDTEGQFQAKQDSARIQNQKAAPDHAS